MILGIVSPGRHVTVIEPVPPQVVDAMRRVGAMARTVSMRPTEWEFSPEEFSARVGAQTDLIIVADPNPYSGQYLPEEARASILAAVRHFGCHVLLDESARNSIVEDDGEDASAFIEALGDSCLRVSVPAAAILANAASAAAVFGADELIAPVRSAASTFGLGANAVAQSVLARRFEDGMAIDDTATLQGIVSSGRALVMDGLDDIGVLGLGGPGGWYVPVRAQALYEGPNDIGEELAARAGLGVLPLAPFYVEGSSDPYILISYLRDAGLLENSLERLARFYDEDMAGMTTLALPPPGDWDVGDIDDDLDEDDFDGDEFVEEIGDEDVVDAADEGVPDDGAFEEEELYAREPEPDPVSPAASEIREERESKEPEHKPAPEKTGDPDLSRYPEPAAELADDDAKYREAMAGAADGPSLIDRIGDEASGEPGEGHRTGAEDEKRDSKILPFGRWRRGAREQAEQDSRAPAVEEAGAGPTKREEPAASGEDAPVQEKEEVPVFKLSVPDIASPNIPVPSRAPEPESASGEDEPGDGSDRAADAEIKNEDDAEAEARRAKDRRDDRPFFFDDPVV